MALNKDFLIYDDLNVFGRVGELNLFCVLKLIFWGSQFETNYFTIKMLSQYLNYNHSKIKELLSNLGIIENNGIYSITKEFFKDNNRKYYKVDINAVKSIIKSEYKEKDKLLYHYILITKSFNIDGIIGNLPLSHFVEKECVSERTIIRYNEKLEDMKLICIKRAVYNDKKKKRETNIYSKYENVNKIHRVEYVNDHRSISLRYNNFVKKMGVGYTEEEKKALYNDVLRYNSEVPVEKRKPLTNFN